MSHGGSFRKFNGLSTHRSNYLVGEATYAGPACLHLKHSKDGLTRSWRDSRTHACLQCIEEIEQRKFGLSLNRFSDEIKKTALKFWSKVDITTYDDCWQWNDCAEKSQLYFFWKRREIRNRFQWHPIVVSMWLCWGDTGRLGSESVCGNRRCVNPLHNLPLGLIPSIRAADYDEEWLNSELHGLKKEVSEYQQRQLLSKSKSTLIPLPGLSCQELEEMEDLSDFSPYQLALQSVSQSIKDGTHVMLKSIL